MTAPLSASLDPKALEAAEAAYIAAPEMKRRPCLEAAIRAYLSHASAPTAPEGYVLVPREPTEAMALAAVKLPGPQGTAISMAIYRAMISAAPQKETGPR